MAKRLTWRRNNGEVCPALPRGFTRSEFDEWICKVCDKLARYEELEPDPTMLRAKLAALEAYKMKEKS